MASLTPTRRRYRPIAGKRANWYESAVAGPQHVWHRLMPDALIGTLRCDARLSPGRTQWKHVDRVTTAERCPVCYASEGT